MVRLGCRVRSGRAVAAALDARAAAPVLLDCRELLLCDPRSPGSRQPYHAALVDHRLQNLSRAKPLIAIVRRAARRSVAALLADYRARGWRVDGAVLVVGSLIDPAAIGNQHMRAHALEGQLFRTALEEALTSAGIACSFLLERSAYDEAAKRLGRRPDALRRAIGGLGRSHEGPWRADEKLAALGAFARF